MDFLKKLFAKKDNKTFINIFTALAVGAGLILIGGMFDDKNNDKPADTTVVSENTTENNTDYKARLEEELEKILGHVSGVGNIEIMITLKNDGQSSLAEDVTREKSNSSASGNAEKEEHKTLLTGEDMPYIINKGYPEVEGILITCEGGGAVEVKSSLISACCALFGIDANKIEVLKMGGN